MPDLHELGDLLDVCLARGEAVIDEDDWSDLAKLRGSVRRRLGFLGEVLVVALAGGTGSGKSSLLNALVGEPVAVVGIERPTTSKSLAVVPSQIDGDLEGLIEALGIDHVVESDRVHRMVFVDLPDFDSTFTSHRLIVDDVLPLVDAVIWVVDPEKYADRLIHDQFLRPLRRYEDQMVFALNQADRLGADTDAVIASLRDHLISDGYTEPEIVPTTAAANETTDLDTTALDRALASRLDVKRSAVVKLCRDLSSAANRYWLLLDHSFEERAGDDRLDTAIAMASLVSLGVAATAATEVAIRGEGSG